MATPQDFLQNPAWVHRMQQVFDRLDMDKNGYLSNEDWELWAKNIEKMVKPAPHLMAALRARIEEYCAALGIVPGTQSTRDEFVKGIAAMAVIERAKSQRGEETLLHKLNDAFYDIVDTNHDGSVTLGEWKVILEACNIESSAANKMFNTLDKNKDGKIGRRVLTDTEFEFWYALDDPDGKGMFGDVKKK